MIKVGSIVRCIRGAGEALIEGKEYTIYHITENGHFLLEEECPPEGYTCFDKSRFEDTNKTVYTEMREYFEDDWTEEMEERYWAEQPNL